MQFLCSSFVVFVFFFNDTATTEIYTLSLHDALPISVVAVRHEAPPEGEDDDRQGTSQRSEEHTSELQSRYNLVCRLLLETKKTAKELQAGSRVGMRLLRPTSTSDER